MDVTVPGVIDYPGAIPEETVPARPMTHAEIADDLEARIRGGEYPPGAFIPSLTAFRELYGVSPSTAEKVATELRRRGLIEQWPGRGNAVVDSLPPPAE